MKIDHIIDYRALTAAHFTTYAQPEEIQRLVARNRTLLADIAANVTNTIARQAEADARNSVLGATVDLVV
jgi:hypothetical protein